MWPSLFGRPCVAVPVWLTLCGPPCVALPVWLSQDGPMAVWTQVVGSMVGWSPVNSSIARVGARGGAAGGHFFRLWY